ncbi:MAG: NAD(P) transhydrogenase subunit alpha, partial [Halobacteria archaeon]|nr:NAD(P) transhydrogenase subunit alpha [Halobacteria archaeon]
TNRDADEIDPYAEEQIVIGRLGPFNVDDEDLEELAERNVTAFALELIPRISRAQSMDTNSSMASIGGYKAVMMAANELPKFFPMEMTAAGTVQPADVFVLGAGVAGLKAISTAERLGANSTANDVRPEVREEVESLGADFVAVGEETEEMSDDEGYATEQDKSFEEKQKEMLMDVVPDSDVVITTAAIPGRPAPQPITNDIVAEMEPGSVIVDLAAESGGNCEPTEAGEVVEYEGVTIFGPTNLPSTVPHTASQLYSNNLKSFLDNLLDEDGEVDIDTEDEIIDSTMLTHDGTVRNPHKDDGGDDGDGDEGDEDNEEEEGDNEQENDGENDE